MKKHLLIAVTILAFHGVSNAYTACLENSKLTAVHIGKISWTFPVTSSNTEAANEDEGNAVALHYRKSDGTTGYVPFPTNMNLNDSQGRAMFALASMALALGMNVSAWGANSTCSTGVFELKATP